MEVEYHTTAGCLLCKQASNGWNIVLIFQNWSADNNGWCLPKGHVEPGESFDETALRETTEETGYKNIELLQKLDPLNIEYPWSDGKLHRKVIHYYLAKLIDDENDGRALTRGEEITMGAPRWFSLDEAEKTLKFDDERQYIAVIKALLAKD